MTEDQFVHECIKCKRAMTIDQAIDFINELKINTFALYEKTFYNSKNYEQNIYNRSACDELIRALKGTPPWNGYSRDYRDIFARMEWKYISRICIHSYDGRYVLKNNGYHWANADKWLLHMWKAYDKIFRALPGAVPNTTHWRRHYAAMWAVETDINKNG